ncbi:MAG TPA: thiamine-phosphate kinase [Thermoanaerobaculia bacterium]|nr:thiamine-phosphate kinase [Thermoanaerobaculia bacterium]
MKRAASEDQLLSWLRGRIPEEATDPLLGDDAALLPRGGPWAVTVDSQIAGIHFDPDLDPAVVARRLLAVNLSDIAATGARPAYAFLALSATPGFDHRRFFSALLADCRRHAVRLAGGDLARQPAATTATLTLLGTLPPGGHRLRRSAAAAGDELWLGGTVGESAAGRRLIDSGARLRGSKVELPEGLSQSSVALRAAARRAVRRHLLPVPQLELGRWLGRQRRAAAIDVSDGLSRDLSRLSRESAVGALVVAEDLPLSDHFLPLCQRIGCDPWELVLGGGEDYVLLFTLPAGRRPPAHFACRRIGEMKASRRLHWTLGGARALLPDRGWDHLSK